MKYFDTHAHIGLINEDPIEQLIITQEARHEKVEHIVSICNSLHDFFIVYDNLRTATNIYHSIGVSPSEVAHPGKDWEAKIEEGVTYDRVVAIGEIGLDYYRKFGDKNSQVELFIKQLEMAQQLNLPVIIHNRDAGEDVLQILSQKVPSKGGVLHCYSENWEYAKRALDYNLYISFAGNVTYRNARNLHETAKICLWTECLLSQKVHSWFLHTTRENETNRHISTQLLNLLQNSGDFHSKKQLKYFIRTALISLILLNKKDSHH